MELDSLAKIITSVGIDAFLIASGVFFVFKYLPEHLKRKHEQQQADNLWREKVTAALEASNTFSAANADIISKNTHTYERMIRSQEEQTKAFQELTREFQSHDDRAVDISKDIALIKGSVLHGKREEK